MSPLRATPKITVLTTWTFFTLILASVTFAAPVHNATAGVQVSKHQTSLGPMTYATEPAGRGTWGILFSCTTTFVFCIWTAVHPNIIPNASVNYRLFYKGVLMVISIINPEGIAIFAFGQLAEARRVKREWDMYVNGKWESTVAKEKKGLFTMEVAFFVVMGGYTIDESIATSDRHVRSKHIQRLLEYGIIPDADKPEEGKVVIERKNSRYTATLTPTGFVKYAKDGYFDDCQFFGDEIKDKGKASNIAKILSATQALWLGAQCATRKAAGLPLSLLEIHVLIQLGCTVVIYLCWWNKPLDVNEPISLVLRKGDAEFRPIQDEEAKDLLEKEVVELDPDPKQHKDSEQRPISNLQSKHPNEIIKEEVLEEGADPKQQKNLDSAEQHKLPLHRSFTLTRCPPCLIAMSDRALHDIIVYLTGATRNMMVLEGLFIAIIAGLHALAWNNHFPTETEAWLWRIACIGMCVCPLAVIGCASMSSKETSYHLGIAKTLWHNHQVQYNPWQWIGQAAIYLYELAEVQAWKAEEQWRRSCIYKHLFILVVCLLLLGAYLACILYLTVASYISLRDPPNGAFVTPKWSDYWPHL